MNKTLILSIISAFSLLSAQGQITKKNWLIGGSALFSTQSQNLLGTNVNGTDINLSPNIGFFAADKFALGARIGFKYNKTSYNSIINKNTRFTFGPFARYYFLKPEKVVNIFTEGSYQYSTVDAGTSSNSENTFRFSAGPAIFFNSSVGLEFTLNYEYFKVVGSETNYNKFFLGIGFQIHLESNKNQ